MEIVDELLFQFSVYVEKGIDFFVAELLTIEGIAGMIIAFFVTSLILQLRS